MSSKFAHLHTHSHYSLLDGLSKIPDMVKIAKKAGMTAMALTDHGNMYGAIEFYKTCKAEGIKPILGVEAYIAERSLEEKETGIDSRRYHLTLLAKNVAGYKNLIQLVTIANLEGYYYKPRMDHRILREHHEGVICLSGCMGSELSQSILAGNTEKSESIIKTYQDIFGVENYFLEVQCHPHVEGDKKLRDGIIALGKKFNIPLVATSDSHYPCADDHKAHETLLAIQTGNDGSGDNKFTFGEDDYSLIDEAEALKIFADIPEAVENTMKVADMCDIELSLGKWVFPVLDIENGKTPDEKLEELARAGIATRGLEATDEVTTRLEYELGIIKGKGYAPYFLVVGDLLRFARESGILTTIRGSVAGSLTTYLLGITNVNPFEYNLPFERFLNPERPSPPDIDMDYADNRRDEVIEYAKQKYGADKVAQIGTFGTMMARGAVRDVARALGHPYGIGDRISKMIPMGSQGFPMTIDHAIDLVPELKAAYKKEADTKEIIDLAKKLEGCVRHISVHAAGVVIAPEPLSHYTPIQLDPKGGKVITQYDMYSIEEAGLLKFDFLGIRNLAILGDAVRLVKERRGIEVDIEKIPLDDRRTFALLARGDTVGLFQLNGSGLTRFLKELKPSTIHDINAMVALYRPGPMQFIPDYIARKHNASLIHYFDPALEAILKRTYGILVYQDDLLTIAHDLAGYSWGEVDKFRKAVGKKIPEEMEAQKEKFIHGCVKTSSWPLKKAERIWTWIEPFAAYGFNKAHAASYGRVAYQTAYMKANFPVEYMCAIMTAESGDIEKVAEIISECEKMGITVLPPDVNESFGGFTVVSTVGDKKKNKTSESDIGGGSMSTLKADETSIAKRDEALASATDNNGISEVPNKNKLGVIRFGLYTIKNLGTDISDAIIAERKTNGPFASIENFIDRITHKNLNKKSLEALVKSGTMDSFGERGGLYGNIELMLRYNKESNVNLNQTSLFGESIGGGGLRLEAMPPATKEEKLGWEKELLGLYVSGHPLDKYKTALSKNQISVKSIKNELLAGMPIQIGCIIEEVKLVTTKKKDQMAFVRVADLTGSIECVVFSKTFKAHTDLLIVDVCIALEGRISDRNGEKSIVVEVMKKL